MKFSKYNLFIPFEGDYLLVNTMNGTLYRVSDDIKVAIEQNKMEKLDENIVKDYYERGIVIDDHIEESRILKYLHNKEKYCTKVLSLTILLTMECNFSCVYCFEGSKTYQKKYLKDKEMECITKFITNMLNEDKNIELVSITLFGGEPLLNLRKCSGWLEKVREICENKKKEFVMGIITNGSLLSEESLDILERCKCQTIQVTLDGTKEIHDSRRFYRDGRGSFDDVISAIKMIKEKSGLAAPIIRININRTNIGCIEELLEYLAENNLNDCVVDFGIIKAGNNENEEYKSKCFGNNELGEILEGLWKSMQRLGYNINVQPMRTNLSCGLYSDKSFTIAPDGSVYKCWEYVEDSRFYLGKLSPKGMINDISYHLFDWMTKEFDENAACTHCVYLPVCGGGCAAVSFEKNKSIHTQGCHKVRGVFEAKVKLSYIESVIRKNK